MIGVLVSDFQLKQLLRGRPSHEVVTFYMEAGREVGQPVVLFSPSLVNRAVQTVRGFTGKAFIETGIPPVVINRIRSTDPEDKAVVLFLKASSAHLFNEENVISKWDTFDALKEAHDIKPYLPETRTFKEEHLLEMLEHYPFLFLKPTTLSLGLGILKVARSKQGVFVTRQYRNRTVTGQMSVDGLIKRIKRQNRDYLIQQGIALKRYRNRVVDYRVSVQKDITAQWKVSGLVAKIGRPGGIVTNLHSGGYSVKARRLFDRWGWRGEEVESSIKNLALQIAAALEKKYPNIADIGLDVGLDNEAFPWFFEANLRDLRITFRDAKEHQMWRETFMNPVRYASYLLTRRENRNINGQELVDCSWDLSRCRLLS